MKIAKKNEIYDFILRPTKKTCEVCNEIFSRKVYFLKHPKIHNST